MRRVSNVSWLCLGTSLLTTLSSACSSSDEDPLAFESSTPELRYETKLQFDGLGETVTIVKTPERAEAIRPSGERMSLGALRALDQQLYQAKYGALTPELHAEITAEKSGRELAIAVQFAAPALAALEASFAGTEEPPPAELAAATLAEDRARVESTLAKRGFVATGRSLLMPMLYGTASASTILALAKDEQIVRIVSDEPTGGDAELSHAVPQSPIPIHQIDDVYNNHVPPQRAKNEKVAVIETWNTSDNNINCAIRDAHEAFSQNVTDPVLGYRITYETEPTACNPNNPGSTCGTICQCVSTGGGNDGVCVNRHGTQTASVISATQGGTPHGAAESQIFFPNKLRPNTNANSDAIYTWLDSQGVRTTSESYLGPGLAQDYYARARNFLVVRGAGNGAASGAGAEACPSVVNGICSGSSTSSALNYRPSCFSNWLNPAKSDREEPDLLTFGGEGDARDCTQSEPPGDYQEKVEVARAISVSTTDWIGDVGTSYSTPSVAAMVLLMREDCGIKNHNVIRAVTRTAALLENPDGTRYSTPTIGTDHKDGGGFLSAKTLDWFCEPGTNDNSGEGTFDLDKGDGSTFKGKSSYDPGHPPESFEPGYGASAYTQPDDGSRVWDIVDDPLALTAGNKLRATIAWDACVTSPTSGSTPKPARDIDLFLMRITNQSGSEYEGVWVTGSQSVDDVNEGFDFTIPTDGKYVIVAGWVPGSGCNGSSSEPFGWAWAVY